MKKATPPNWIRMQMMKWGKWEDVSAASYTDPEHAHLFAGAWRNNVYSVKLYRGDYSNIPGCQMLSIMRCDAKPGIPWWVKMVIKDDLVGPEHEAIEIYPPADEIIDPASIYYLVCFPIGFSMGMHMKHTTSKPPAHTFQPT